MKTVVRLLQLFIMLIIGVAPLNAATRVLVLSLDE